MAAVEKVEMFIFHWPVITIWWFYGCAHTSGSSTEMFVPVYNAYNILIGTYNCKLLFSLQTPSAAMARVIEEQLGDVFELEYIHLIRFFLLAEPEKETPAATQSSKQNDPLFMLFCQPKLGMKSAICYYNCSIVYLYYRSCWARAETLVSSHCSDGSCSVRLSSTL